MKLARLLGAAVAVYFMVSTSFLPHFAAADKAVGDEYQLNGIDPYDSPVKPVLSLSRIELTLEEAMESPTQTVELRVKGADRKYAPTALHINYDERLTIVMEDGYYADRGKAIDKLDDVQYPSGPHSFGLVTAGAGNFGRDGLMWSFRFTLPDDMKEGDVYPICIEYRRPGVTNDLFTDVKNDEVGKMMEAWVFTNGIEHGYIKIKEAPPETETTTAEPVTTSTVTTTETTTTTTTTVTTTSAATTTVTTSCETTTAETVTTVKPEPALKLGDPTGDGLIDAVDSSYVLAAYARFSTSGEGPDERCIATCDVNRDGFVDAVDSSKVLAYYAYMSADGWMDIEEVLRRGR